MKNLPFIFLIAFVIFASYLGMTSKYRKTPAQAVVSNVTPQKFIAVTQRPTSTPIPSATTDWQGTAQVAQSTADEARRINAQATAQHEAFLISAAQLTAAVEQNNMQLLAWTAQSNQWTATLAATSIPLTATAQKVYDAQLAAKQTSTHEAPMLAQQMLNVEYDKKYGDMNHKGFIFFEYAGAILVISIAFRLFWKSLTENKTQEQEQPEEIESEFVPAKHIIEDKGDGYSPARFVVPCTPEQLTIISEMITQGQKTLAINQWEQASTKVGKPVIVNFRNWLSMAREQDFVRVGYDKQMIPETALLIFMGEWLDDKTLPMGYTFENPPTPTEATQELRDVAVKDIHRREFSDMNHRNNGGGGVAEASGAQ